jgi:hypothetical protein
MPVMNIYKREYDRMATEESNMGVLTPGMLLYRDSRDLSHTNS